MERPVFRAHNVAQRERTDDIALDQANTFAALTLSEPVLRGLAEAGFVHPSPIQARAIPLGKCGLDVMAQAKAGTGKTLVFATVALEAVKIKERHPQVLVLAPTREIAFQIYEVFQSISKHVGAVTHCFIGGLSVANDVLKLDGCHIAVGTPGRLQELAEREHLDLRHVRLCVLDEADKLLSGSIAGQTRTLLAGLPRKRQLMAFSATYPEDTSEYIQTLMHQPAVVRLDAAAPALRGVRQFLAVVPDGPAPVVYEAKLQVLLRLLASTEYHQCMVFTTVRSRTELLCDALCDAGWPAAAMSASQTQLQRIHTLDDLRLFRVRVLVSTDLTSRGVDLERVNLVVNFDLAPSPETHLHRVGRAGRFGSRGVCVTLCSTSEQSSFSSLMQQTHTSFDPLPDTIPRELYGSGEGDQGVALPRNLTLDEIEERRAARVAAAAEQEKKRKKSIKARDKKRRAAASESDEGDEGNQDEDGEVKKPFLSTSKLQPPSRQVFESVPVPPHASLTTETHRGTHPLAASLAAPHIQQYISFYMATLIKMNQ
eukprot:m.64343 g.64343  ORF g.64343 m.64343 type:complete len:541 (+) comp12516_c0_seq2:162-1784(+)